jgi:hypothetical protein
MILHHDDDIDVLEMWMLVGNCKLGQSQMLHGHTIHVLAPKGPKLNATTFVQLGHKVNVHWLKLHTWQPMCQTSNQNTTTIRLIT